MWKEQYEKWLNNPNLDSDLRIELNDLNEEELEECFYKNIEFGTAGMRGIMLPGPNKMNVHTITKAAYGLSEYVKEKSTNPSVVIAYDSRINSKLFSNITASVLSNEGVKVYLFDQETPTPMLSFALRHLECDGGVVITASHNPKNYNGFKVYNNTGAQLNLEQSETLTNNVENFSDFLDYDLSNLNKENITMIGEEINQAYLKSLEALKINNTEFKNSKFVFSPLFGTSWNLVSKACEDRGMNTTVVESQKLPDGTFPDFELPNPENREVFEKGIEIADIINADAVFTTDPDADRLGIAIKHNGSYEFLDGNEQGILATIYLLNSLKLQNKLPSNPLILSSIVSTKLIKNIAKQYETNVEYVLTGFKFIGEKIEKYNESKEYNFVFGFEESYGCLVKDFARDKDAIQATLLFSEMIDFYKQNNLTLIDVLNKIYDTFGYSKTHVQSYSFDGITGLDKMKDIMSKFRDIESINVEEIILDKKTDYLDPSSGLPSANVLLFTNQSEDIYVYLRPSGTEPKLKVYIETISEDSELNEKNVKLILDSLDKAINV